ncbi:probable amidase At4g34880 [Triticum aestivum]|uniref:probable amidase At4g34880 n=1 Tax=Triticum aestivum TaxID=4565 RepID=UPI001D013099|nr:probable amidase At4g34880 [Triticum aestivum]
MQAEFKLSINAYLADFVCSPAHSLADIIVFNNQHPEQERMKDFGQDGLIAAQNTKDIDPVEREAIQRLKELSANGLEKLMKEHQLNATGGSRQPWEVTCSGCSRVKLLLRTKTHAAHWIAQGSDGVERAYFFSLEPVYSACQFVFGLSA